MLYAEHICNQPVQGKLASLVTIFFLYMIMYDILCVHQLFHNICNSLVLNVYVYRYSIELQNPADWMLRLVTISVQDEGRTEEHQVGGQGSREGQ